MRIDLAGQRFGRLEVIARFPPCGSATLWLCGCDCGETKAVATGNLRAKHVLSCGCLRREMKRASGVNLNRRHGYTAKGVDSGAYRSWQAMIQRCTNPRHGKFEYYGGRGIAVCARWRSFTNFIADMGERPHDMSIDRINVNAGHEPGNCRWATSRQQTENKRKQIWSDRSRQLQAQRMRGKWKNGTIVPRPRKA